jgi:ABC-type antimicrobial peptide transport system permease subunit
MGVLQALAMTALLMANLPRMVRAVYQMQRGGEADGDDLISSKRQNCKDLFTNPVLDWDGMIQYINSAFAFFVTHCAADAAGRGRR